MGATKDIVFTVTDTSETLQLLALLSIDKFGASNHLAAGCRTYDIQVRNQFKVTRLILFLFLDQDQANVLSRKLYTAWAGSRSQRVHPTSQIIEMKQHFAHNFLGELLSNNFVGCSWAPS